MCLYNYITTFTFVVTLLLQQAESVQLRSSYIGRWGCNDFPQLPCGIEVPLVCVSVVSHSAPSMCCITFSMVASCSYTNLYSRRIWEQTSVTFKHLSDMASSPSHRGNKVKSGEESQACGTV